MEIETKVFGVINIDEEKIIKFPNGIIGFPDLTDFTLVHDLEKEPGGIHWLQSIQEPGFAMPVMNPLMVRPDYNPEVNDELLEVIHAKDDEILVLVTITVPKDITKMSVNLQGPVIINVEEKLACQVIVEGNQFPVKYPIYDMLKAKKEGE